VAEADKASKADGVAVVVTVFGFGFGPFDFAFSQLFGRRVCQEGQLRGDQKA
jgi:hypothetical protein